MQVAFNDPVDLVRQVAFGALGILGDKRAIPQLLGVTQDKNANQTERTLAINSLYIADTNAIPPLKAIVLDETDDIWVRAEAAGLLPLVG